MKMPRLTPPGRFWVISVPYLWLFLFFLLPFAIVLKISFSEAAIAIPPYQPIFQYVEQKLNVSVCKLLNPDKAVTSLN